MATRVGTLYSALSSNTTSAASDPPGNKVALKNPVVKRAHSPELPSSQSNINRPYFERIPSEEVLKASPTLSVCQITVLAKPNTAVPAARPTHSEALSFKDHEHGMC